MKQLLLLLSLLAAFAGGQIAVYEPTQVWSDATLEKYRAAGLYDAKTGTLRISCFDYNSNNGDPASINYWILSNKLNVIAAFKARTGLNVELLIRCPRTRGTAWDTVPSDPVEQSWWASFVAGKAALGKRDLGGWNERSLSWFGTDSTPENDAACVHALVSLVKSTGVKVLAPTIHAPSDSVVGNGLTYTRRFFAALPVADRPYVAPDAHLYYGANDYVAPSGILTREYSDLAAWQAAHGYPLSACYASEGGCFYQATTQAQVAAKLKAIVTTLKSAGIPASHFSAWQGGIMQVFNSDGSLTVYGNCVKLLAQTP